LTHLAAAAGGILIGWSMRGRREIADALGESLGRG
jgi:hypothetical protein